MRTYKNLFNIERIKPTIDYYQIGYTKVYIYHSIDKNEDICFSKRIKVLFQLCIYDNFQLFWFSNEEELYQNLEEYLELDKELYWKFIIIID